MTRGTSSRLDLRRANFFRIDEHRNVGTTRTRLLGSKSVDDRNAEIRISEEMSRRPLRKGCAQWKLFGDEGERPALGHRDRPDHLPKAAL